MDFRSAVYYPHTKLQSPALLKHSLLLWVSGISTYETEGAG